MGRQELHWSVRSWGPGLQVMVAVHGGPRLPLWPGLTT